MVAIRPQEALWLTLIPDTLMSALAKMVAVGKQGKETPLATWGTALRFCTLSNSQSQVVI